MSSPTLLGGAALVGKYFAAEVVHVVQRDGDQDQHDDRDADDTLRGPVPGEARFTRSTVLAVTRLTSSRHQRHQRYTAKPPNTHHSIA